MRFRPTRIKRSSAESDLSQGPIVFGHKLRKRFSELDGNVPTWLPQTSLDLLRGQQATILENNRGMDPGLLAAMLDRNTLEMTSDDSPLVQRPTTAAERIGQGLTAGTFLGSALQLAPTTSNTTRALLGLAGLGVGLGLAHIGPRHALGRSAVEEWETSPDKPDVVQIPRPDRGLLNGAIPDAVIGGVGGGTVAMLSGVNRLVPFGASVGIGAAGLAALNQALAARGDRIYSGRSKQSSAPNLDEYFKSQEDYVNLRKDEHRNNAALSLLGAVPGAALSGLGMYTLMKNLPNLTLAKGALGVTGLLGGGVLASLPSKLMQRSDTRYRRETGIDPGFEAPPMGAPAALASAGASIGLGTGLAMTLSHPALAAAAAGVAGLTGILAVSRAMKRDREQADFAAENDQGAYAAGRGLTEGNRFIRNLSLGMRYVSPVAPNERVIGSG